MKRYVKIALGVLAALAVAAGIGWASLDQETRGLLKTLPTNRDILFWTVPQRDAAFRALDRISLLAKWRVIEPSAQPRALPPGPPLALPMDLDAYLAGQRAAALLVLHKGQLRLERYGLGFDDSGRWTSFSVAKSFTSTLVGAAVRDGQIRLDEKVSHYLPAMKGSAYDEVSVRQLLTMTSGVRWNEDYNDPQSDVAQFNNHKSTDGSPAIVSYLRQLPRAAAPGERWNYSNGETNLVGILLEQATGKNLSQLLQDKIWQPAGMAQRATWVLSKTGQEISGCCLQASPKDYARFGQFILEGARVQGQPLLPDDWLAQATTRQADIGLPSRGYGYQWWTYDSGSFTARGIFGQGIFIDPQRQLVIVCLSNWAGGARDPEAGPAREAFYQAVQKAIDAESAAR